MIRWLVGIILAVLFAGVMGACFSAVLVTDYMQPGRVVSDQARETLLICGEAAAISALLAWALQFFAARKNIVSRFVYGFIVYTLAFLAVGGTLLVINNYTHAHGTPDYSPTGIYFASVGGFYSFAVFLMGAFKAAIPALLLAAGLYLAIVGPRRVPERREYGYREGRRV